MSEIYKLLPLIANEIGAIGKNKKNQQQGYNFRGIDDIYNAAHEPMVKHGVFCTTKVSDLKREDRQSKSGGGLIYTTLTLEVTFWAPDGSNVATTTVGEGMDSGDKSANKAMSTALKYAFFQTFIIPTEEMLDTEKEHHEVAAPAQDKKPAKPPANNPAMPPEQAAFNAWVKPLIGTKGLTSEFVRDLSVKHGYAVARTEIEKLIGATA